MDQNAGAQTAPSAPIAGHGASKEEYLSGTEATVTILPPPPGSKEGEYEALPIVIRENHVDGIAPYSGKVAVTVNSRVISPTSPLYTSDPSLRLVQEECIAAARILQVKAPIRIDVRKKRDADGEVFKLFDVNMKPNMTCPGRPGREDQASLTLLAAEGRGWDAAKLVERMVEGARGLRELREVEMPEVR